MAPKAKTTAVRAQPTKAKAAPTGLQLSAAQWKAYNAAYSASLSASYRRLAIAAAAQSLRNARLSAAYSLGKKVAAAHAAARTAAIAAFAVRMSFKQSQQAHQNAALQSRVYADYVRHVQSAARLQFIYKGEKTYLHSAVASTLTTAQAVNVETVRFAQAAKAAKAAVASTTTPAAKLSPGAVRAQASAKAAGLAAAKATPKGRTAPRPAKLGPLCNPRSVGMFGDPAGYDCVAAAIASHLSFTTGYTLADSQYACLRGRLGKAPLIKDALRLIREEPPWPEGPVLADYEPAEPGNGTRLIAGFATVKGPHAALLLSRLLIASWGEMLRLESVMTPGTGIEEAWKLTWVT